MKIIRSRAAVAVLAIATLSACSDPFQVIEETEFAASLGVDLSMMERLDNGVYIMDRVVGTGPELVYGSQMTYTFTGWLADGTEWDSNTFTILFTDVDGAIAGFDEGILGMREGGTRLLVIPPEQAYGDEDRRSSTGVPIPAGSILVMEVTLDEVLPPS